MRMVIQERNDVPKPDARSDETEAQAMSLSWDDDHLGQGRRPEQVTFFERIVFGCMIVAAVLFAGRLLFWGW